MSGLLVSVRATGDGGATSDVQISLVRHGRPAVDFSRGSADRVDWVESYDLAGIDPDLPPPDHVRELHDASAFALSSDLPRAIESLGALGRKDPPRPERLFREVALRGLPIVPFRLDPEWRAGLARFGWRFGWSFPTESAFAMQRRARAASERLAALASTHGSVLLLGHGYFNTLLAWRLLAAGWRGPLWPTGSYWSAAVYRKAAPVSARRDRRDRGAA